MPGKTLLIWVAIFTIGTNLPILNSAESLLAQSVTTSLPSTAAAHTLQNSRTGADPSENHVPDSLEAGQQRLNTILSHSDGMSPWAFPIDIDHEYTPEDGSSRVANVTKGSESLSLPFRLGEALAIDSLQQWQFRIFDIEESGNRRISRSGARHNAVRTSLRLRDGIWFFDSRFLTHSKPDYIESPYHRGTVLWHADGFELKGIGGFSRVYGAAGKMLPVVGFESRRFIRKGDTLTIQRKVQNYAFLIGPDGHQLPLPDFSQPLGEPFEEEKSCTVE